MLLCDYYRPSTFIIGYAVLVDLNRFLLSLLYVFVTVSSYFSYACCIVYFVFLYHCYCYTIAILTALNYVARTFVTCFSINTQYSMQTNDNNVSVDNTKSSSKIHKACRGKISPTWCGAEQIRKCHLTPDFPEIPSTKYFQKWPLIFDGGRRRPWRRQLEPWASAHRVS